LSYNTPVGCGANSAYVFNVQPNLDGTSAVTVQGEGQQFTDSSNVVYNFPASGNKRDVLAPLRTISTPNGGLVGSTLAPNCNLNAGTGTNTGITIAGNIANSRQFNKPNCPTPVTPPTNPNGDNLCPYFESDCAGLQFPLGNTIGSFRDFNVVSFGDYNANTGDIEGRLAVQNNLNLGAGYSVGYQLQTANGQDAVLPYSVVVGGNAVFVSGAVFPEGNGIPYPGAEEDLFVGGTFTGEADLAARVLGSCNGVAGCLDTTFNAAHECYSNYQLTLSSQSDTVSVNIEWSALELTCSDNTATAYTVTLTASQLNSATYYVVNNCNLQATWAINIPGNDNVTFAGDSFPAMSGAVVYNILGSGRYIIVETEVAGSILAPDNILYQTGGVIDGKLVIGDVALALQVNKPNCPNPTPVTLNGVADSSNAGSSHMAVLSGKSAFVDGDSVNVGSQSLVIASVDSDGFNFDSDLNKNTNPGQRVWTVVLDPTKARSGNGNGSGSQSATASSIQVTFALLLVALIAALF